MPVDTEDGSPAGFDAWVGRQTEQEDVLAAERVAALAAALDENEPPAAADLLPPLRHWLFFWTLTPGSGLGRDGHPRLGGFLPPVGEARRMWAGSRVSFPGHLALGSRVRRRSTIERITTKSGRSGRLVFVSLRHELFGNDRIAIVDEQDLVYREGVGGSPAPSAGGQPPGEAAPPTALFRILVAPNSALLFRYSALTFNAHRIHYDRPYATEVEGYPGLVVQGPLLATLMVDLACRAWPERRLASFSFRGRRPIIEGRPFAVCADPESVDRLRLWIADADGCLAMDGQATFA